MSLKINRRTFLQITGMTALAAGLGYRFRQRMLETGSLKVAAKTIYKMGTLINFQLVTEDLKKGYQDIAEVIWDLDEMIFNLDHRQPGSPLWLLNQDGEISSPPGDLVEVLTLADTISQETDGALDVTIKPALDLYKENQDVPLQVMQLVDYRLLEVSDNFISLPVPGMAVTLDGIAKGWIVDQVSAKFRSLGYANFLVEAGGDLYLAGKSAGMDAWQVGLRHPRDQHQNTFTGQDLGLATSGEDQNAFSGDFTRHHILDPRQGFSPRELSSVTVSAPTAAEADGLSTAIMILGVKDGLKLLESWSGVETLLVDKNGNRYQSSGFSGGSKRNYYYVR